MKTKRHKRGIILSALLLTISLSLTACGSSVSQEDYDQLREELKELKAENKELIKELEELKGSDVPVDEVASNSSSKDDKNNDDSVGNDFIVETSGVCGADLKWEYGNGTLVIKGKGDMSDYEQVSLGSGKYTTNAPWAEISDKIGHVVIEKGVTSIGSSAFSYLSNLSKVSIPNTITVIEERAFYHSGNLKEVTLPDNLSKVGEYALEGGSDATAEAAAAPAAEACIEDGELMYVVEYKSWKCVMNYKKTVIFKGVTYQNNNDLCDNLSAAGVDVPYNKYERTVRACDYTPDMGEIVEEYYYY